MIVSQSGSQPFCVQDTQPPYGAWVRRDQVRPAETAMSSSAWLTQEHEGRL